MSFQNIKQKFIELKREVDEAKVSSPIDCTNETRRKLYSKLELLRIDLEILFPGSVVSEEGDSKGSKSNLAGANVECTDIFVEMDTIGKSLRLVPLNTTRSLLAKKYGTHSIFHSIWRWLDIIIRFIAVTCGFVTIGIFLSLPIIFIQWIDNNILMKLNIVNCYTQLSEYIRRFVGAVFLLLSGIFVTVEGLQQDMTAANTNQHEHHTNSCPILTFTHASNLDGFCICSTCPIRHYALAKKELFVVPFFSWISLAVGGVPVDRNNRERAINALKRSTETMLSNKNSGSNQACIVVAPEGKVILNYRIHTGV